MIQPKPFTLKCPKCGWSKKIKPQSDVFDMSWGIEYKVCPKCGTPTEHVEESGTFETIKRMFGRDK